MKKRKITAVIMLIIAILAAIAFVVWFTVGRPLDKKVTAKGYEISVPNGWTSDSNGILTDKKGNVVGSFRLINEQPDLNNTPSYSGFEVKGDVKTENKTAVIVKSIFETNKGRAVQYFIKDIPNPEPYAISITLLNTGVGDFIGERIAASLKIPEIGSRPPQKNVVSPEYHDIGEDKVAKQVLSDGNIMVKNISLIDAFVDRQKKSESTGLDILSYEQTENGVSLRTWSHIESDNGTGYLYTYYEKDGVYTYDNNPVIFESITKEILDDKKSAIYMLKIGKKETTPLFEAPINPYSENAETLVSLKTDEGNDNSIMDILKVIFTKEQLDGITAQKTDNSINIVFKEGVKADKSKLSKDMTVLFSLVSDIKTINVKETSGESFVFERDDMLKKVETPADVAVSSTEKFTEFAEEVEEVILPAVSVEEKANEGTYSQAADGSIVYSTTVVLSKNSKVKHPKTGKMVEIGPYAERYGVSGYLGKPIYCTIKKIGSTFMATATCNGSVIYSQPLESEAAVKSAINQMKAYSK